MRSSACNRRSMAGNCRINAGKRGTSQWVISAVVADNVNTAGRWRSPIFSTAVCNRLNACALACCRILPSAVNSTLRGVLSNTLTPSRLSSSRIWWLIAVGETPISSAASLKLCSLATASKARNDPRGGSFLFMMSYFHLWLRTMTLNCHLVAGYFLYAG
ncbi:hypothetical protein D3C79_167830 [compost metagenome]